MHATAFETKPDEPVAAASPEPAARRRPLAGEDVLLVHPAWHSCGSHRVFIAQAEAYAALGAEVYSLAMGANFGQGSSNRGFWRDYYAMTPDLVVQKRFHTGPSRFFFRRPALLPVVAELRLANYARQLAGVGELSPIPGELRRRPPPAVIHCNHYFCLPLALALRDAWGGKVPVVLETHDVQARQFELRGAVAVWNGRRASFEEMLASEVAVARKADLLIHINREENAFFAEQIPDGRHAILYPPVEIAEKEMPRTDSFLLVASANHPNVVSLEWFLREVMPLIDHEEIAIVGNVDGAMRGHAPDLFARYAHLFKGRASAVKPYYDNAIAVLLPTTAGHGLSIKTVEAMAAGLPIIATTPAFRGLDVDPATLGNVFLGDDAPSFAAHMQRVRAAALGEELADGPASWQRAVPNRRTRETSDTRRFYLENLSFPRYVETLWSIVSRVIPGKSGTAPG